MKYPLLALIKLYQWTISPLLGPVCKYYPSCSH
ncbi:membrane protein insertion efficiency factor YidD [Streptomyces violaceorubidus]